MSLHRRTLLRGVGAALALPFLEAMMPRAIAGGASAAFRAERPRSLAILYVPNGVHMPDWTPEVVGKSPELPWILESLAPHANALTVWSGLVADKARPNGDGPGDHARAAAAMLTGMQPNKQRVEVGESIDQAIARQVGGMTRLRSLTLGLERGAQNGQCDSGYPCAYSSNISWSSKTTPNLKEIDPRRVFDSLFRDPLYAGGKPAQDRRRSILDLVRGESRALSKKLASSDRARLEEFEAGIASLEARLLRAGKTETAAPEGTSRPGAGDKASYEQHLELMLELLALGLITDSTRVATCMFANEGSNRSYPNLDVPEGHHSISHHGKDPAKLEQIRRINRFHVEHLARLTARLANAQEGNGSVLDRSRLVYASGIGDGDRHNHDNLPVLVLGGQGRGHVRLEKPRPICDLYLGLAREMGAGLPRFGDSREELALAD